MRLSNVEVKNTNLQLINPRQHDYGQNILQSMHDAMLYKSSVALVVLPVGIMNAWH
jgi:hypothetical protein